MVESTSSAYGCAVDLDWRSGYPPTVNHVDEAERAATIAGKIVGSDNILVNPEPSMGAEDFAFMLKQKPGAYVWLGAGLQSENLHSPHFDFNDEILPIGASFWVRLAESKLAQT